MGRLKTSYDSNGVGVEAYGSVDAVTLGTSSLAVGDGPHPLPTGPSYVIHADESLPLPAQNTLPLQDQPAATALPRRIPRKPVGSRGSISAPIPYPRGTGWAGETQASPYDNVMRASPTGTELSHAIYTPAAQSPSPPVAVGTGVLTPVPPYYNALEASSSGTGPSYIAGYPAPGIPSSPGSLQAGGLHVSSYHTALAASATSTVPPHTADSTGYSPQPPAASSPYGPNNAYAPVYPPVMPISREDNIPTFPMSPTSLTPSVGSNATYSPVYQPANPVLTDTTLTASPTALTTPSPPVSPTPVYAAIMPAQNTSTFTTSGTFPSISPPLVGPGAAYAPVLPSLSPISSNTTVPTSPASPTIPSPPISSSITDSPFTPFVVQPTVPQPTVPTSPAPVTTQSSPSVNSNNVVSPTFPPITPVSAVTSVPTSPTSPNFAPVPPIPAGGYPRLVKPIVIPQVLNHTKSPNVLGRPFIRCFAKVLSNYNLSQDEFLAFLDELNIDQAGHVGFEYTRKAGKAIHLAGHFDPTGITKLVGKGVEATASLGQVAYMKGPVSKKKMTLDKANKEIFAPRGLKASIVTGKELRQILSLDPKHPLSSPLMTGWVVPTKAELLAGQRAKCRVVSRIMYHLLAHVEDVVLAGEANESLITAAGSSAARNTAAKHVRDWQVGSEVQHELWRGEALALYTRAKTATNEKEKQKLLKKAAEADKELLHVEKINWLVVQNLDAVAPIATV